MTTFAFSDLNLTDSCLSSSCGLASLTGANRSTKYRIKIAFAPVQEIHQHLLLQKARTEVAKNHRMILVRKGF